MSAYCASDVPPTEDNDFDFEPPPVQAIRFRGDRNPFYACLRCDKKRPLEKSFRLCAFCIAELKRDPKEERYWLDADRGRPETACEASPGSEGKIEAMRARLLAGEDLHHPADNQNPALEPARLAALLAEPVRRSAGYTGLERDGNFWRVRPMHGGVKHNLGSYPIEDEDEAVAVVHAFWLDTLGLDDSATPEEIEEARQAAAEQSRMNSRAKVVETRLVELRATPTLLYDLMEPASA